nr:hypothetical protein [Escherichia coli]
MLSCLPGAPSAPGCLAASGRQARLRQAAAGAPASLRRTRWRGFGLALILTTAVLSCLPGAPSAPGCLAASGRQARLRQAAAGAPASLRRTRWRGFGLSLRSDA